MSLKTISIPRHAFTNVRTPTYKQKLQMPVQIHHLHIIYVNWIDNIYSTKSSSCRARIVLNANGNVFIMKHFIKSHLLAVWNGFQ